MKSLKEFIARIFDYDFKLFLFLFVPVYFIFRHILNFPDIVLTPSLGFLFILVTKGSKTDSDQMRKEIDELKWLLLLKGVITANQLKTFSETADGGQTKPHNSN